MDEKKGKRSKKDRFADEIDGFDAEVDYHNKSKSLDEESFPVPAEVFQEFSDAVGNYRQARIKADDRARFRFIPGVPTGRHALGKATLRLNNAIEGLLHARDATIVTRNNASNMISVPAKAMENLDSLSGFQHRLTAAEAMSLPAAHARLAAGRAISGATRAAFPVGIGAAVFHPTIGVPLIDATVTVVATNWEWLVLGGIAGEGLGEGVSGRAQRTIEQFSRKPKEQRKPLRVASEIVQETASLNRRQALEAGRAIEDPYIIEAQAARQLQPVYFQETHALETFDQLAESVALQSGADWTTVHDDLIARTELAINVRSSVLEDPKLRPFSVLMEVFSNQSLFIKARTREQQLNADRLITTSNDRLADSLEMLGLGDLMDPNGSKGHVRDQLLADPQAPLDLRLVRHLGIVAACRDLDSTLSNAPMSEKRLLVVPARREFASTTILGIANQARSVLGLDQWNQHSDAFVELEPEFLQPNTALDHQIYRNSGLTDGLC